MGSRIDRKFYIAIAIMIIICILIWQFSIFTIPGTAIRATGFNKIKPMLKGCGLFPDGKFKCSIVSGEKKGVIINDLKINGEYEETRYLLFHEKGSIDCMLKKQYTLSPLEPTYISVPYCGPDEISKNHYFEITMIIEYSILGTNTSNIEKGIISGKFTST